MVGDTTVVRLPDRVEVRIVGLATFGGADSQGSATCAGFTADFADEVLLPSPVRRRASRWRPSRASARPSWSAASTPCSPTVSRR